MAFEGKYTSLYYYTLAKNFLKNWKDYLFLMFCNVVIFSCVFIGFGMQDIMTEVSDHRGTGIFSDVTTILLNTFIPMAIISIIMSIILFFYYLKCKVRNKGILLTLGIRRQSLYYFVAAEFASVLLVSMIIGGIVGKNLGKSRVKFLDCIGMRKTVRFIHTSWRGNKMATILKAENLIRNYGQMDRDGEWTEAKVLKGLTFEIEENEFVGIMGKSGCEKTTLLRKLWNDSERLKEKRNTG